MSANDKIESSNCESQMSTKDNGNTGSKAFGSIMVIVAVCTGLWALMGPTTQRIDHIADEVKGIKEQLQRSGACASQEQSRLAQMQERFRETVIMGLRMLRGVSLGELESRFGINGVEVIISDINTPKISISVASN